LLFSFARYLHCSKSAASMGWTLRSVDTGFKMKIGSSIKGSCTKLCTKLSDTALLDLLSLNFAMNLLAYSKVKRLSVSTMNRYPF